MLRFILADAEVELVPLEIAGHPAIRNTAREQNRKPSEVLFDQNVHFQAASGVPDGKRRGRPDIVHYTLLVLLESPLAKSGGLEVAIHTRNKEFIRVRSDTRLPRGESRFQGLIAKVLREGRSHDKDPLIWLEERCEASDALARFAKGTILRLDEHGDARTPAQVVEAAEESDMTLVLGAFPSGDYSDAWKTAAPQAVSIWKDALNAWAVAGELVAAWRTKWGP